MPPPAWGPGVRRPRAPLTGMVVLGMVVLGVVVLGVVLGEMLGGVVMGPPGAGTVVPRAMG